MEAQAIAWAHNCRSLLLIIDMVASVSGIIGLPKDLTFMHVPVHEDHDGALILAQTLPPQSTP